MNTIELKRSIFLLLRSNVMAGRRLTVVQQIFFCLICCLTNTKVLYITSYEGGLMIYLDDTLYEMINLTEV